jgi:hypothetical protein
VEGQPIVSRLALDIHLPQPPGGPGRAEDRSDRGRLALVDALASDGRIPFMLKYGKISRRTWLKGMAVFSAAGMPMMLASTAAEAKASKAAVHYQDQPNGMRMCQMCKFFISARGGRSSRMGCPMGGGMMGHGMIDGARCLPTGRRHN